MGKYFTKFRLFLIGILVGQVLMVPSLLRWKNCPVIYAFPVSNTVYKTLPTYEEHIANVITCDVPHKTNMHIYLMDINSVHKIFKQIYGYDDVSVLGFYLYDEDTKTHLIYCVRSPEVVIHEIRHAFEGHFHRS